MDDEYRDEEMDGWQADLELAQASARDTAPIVAVMYRSLLAESLSQREACDLAGAWVAAIGRE